MDNCEEKPLMGFLLLKTVGGRNLSTGFSNTRWWLTLLSELTRAKRHLGEAGEVCGPVHVLPDLGT